MQYKRWYYLQKYQIVCSQRHSVKIVKSHHPTPNIIENDNGSMTPVHRVMPCQYNLRPRIIPSEYLQPRSMLKQQRLAYPRLLIIPHPISVLPTRVPMLRHHYNLRLRRKVAYYCTLTVKFYLAADMITAMEANTVVHPITRVS